MRFSLPGLPPQSFSWDLLGQFIGRQITQSTRGSVLGLAWVVISPLLHMALYLVVFGVLFGGSFNQIENETNLSYGIGIFIGLSVVNLTNESIARSTSFLYQHRSLIKNVTFPLALLPLSLVAANFVKFSINMLLWLVFCLLLGTAIHWQILLLPLLVLPLLLLSIGIAYFLSALSVYFRDIQSLTNSITQVVFWSSGVFFSTQQVREVPLLWSFLQWHPFLLAVENLRAVALWNMQPDWSQIAFLYAVGSTAAALGFLWFQRLKSGFSDLL